MDAVEQKILAKHLARFIIEDVFNLITDEDLLRVIGPNVWEHKGKRLTEGQVKALKIEARNFRDSNLWKILKDEIRYNAQKKTLEKGTSDIDLIGGKILSYLIDIMQTKIDTMSKE